MPHTGMLYLDVDLNKDTEFKTSINEQWNTFVYVYEGVMAVKDVHVQSGQLAIFSDGDSLNFRLMIQMVLDVLLLAVSLSMSQFLEVGHSS